MKFVKLGNQGYILEDLPKRFWGGLKNSIEIKNALEKANSGLAGNIEKEYYIKIEEELKEWISDLGSSLGMALDRNFDNLDFLGSPWVNYQKKYEFNPMHHHSGSVSFVIWYDIPYLIENEKSLYPDVPGGSVAGNFTFYYTNNEKIHSHDIPVDKTWSKKIAVFPSKLQHGVHPFYTSDDYRITISGNFR